MAEKKHEQSSFTITDRRLFTEDGERRKDVEATEEVEAPRPAPVAPAAAAQPSAAAKPLAVPPPVDAAANQADAPDVPPPPTADEQQAQADAYTKSSKELDSRVELSGHSAKEFEMTFERFLASLYMTAMLQMGMMHEQGGQPRVDIIGARQTIDTLALIAEKTKGNLTAIESNFLANSLYEVRMAYVDVTNALSRPPQPGVATGTGGR
jgi:hypothetical protein